MNTQSLAAPYEHFSVPSLNYGALSALFTCVPFGVVDGKLHQSRKGGARDGESALGVRGAQKTPNCGLTVFSTAGGSRAQRGQCSPLPGYRSIADPAGQHITKAS